MHVLQAVQQQHQQQPLAALKCATLHLLLLISLCCGPSSCDQAVQQAQEAHHPGPTSTLAADMHPYCRASHNEKDSTAQYTSMQGRHYLRPPCTYRGLTTTCGLPAH